MRTLMLRRRAGHGWHCAPCKIYAGHPDDAFSTEQDARAGLEAHVADSHSGTQPPGADIDEFTWRG